MKTLRFSPFLAVLCLVFLIFLGSCKPTGPSVADITIVDEVGAPVQGVTVKLFCTEPTCIIDEEAVSDEAGKTRFEFDLPAVLKIWATKVISVKWEDPADSCQKKDRDVTFFAEGFIKLEEHEEVSETVVVFPDWIDSGLCD